MTAQTSELIVEMTVNSRFREANSANFAAVVTSKNKSGISGSYVIRMIFLAVLYLINVHFFGRIPRSLILDSSRTGRHPIRRYFFAVFYPFGISFDKMCCTDDKVTFRRVLCPSLSYLSIDRYRKVWVEVRRSFLSEK